MNTDPRFDRAELGSGLSFPFRIDQRGGLSVSKNEERIRQSIMLILATAKGERVMRPDFGCGIHDLVFAALDATSLQLIRSSVQEALERWEPRIDVDAVDLSTEQIGDGVLMIHVRYRIRSTNFSDNIVYPFYVNAGA